MPSNHRLPSPLLLTPLLAMALLIGFGAALAEEGPSGEEAAASVAVVPPQIILKTQAAPEYPPAALAGRFTGSVTVELTVQPDGSVGKAKAIECDHPNLGFEQATVDAVKKWRFEPARDAAGEPVEFTASFRLHFRRTPGGIGSSRVPFYVTADAVNTSTVESRDRAERSSTSRRTPVNPGTRTRGAGGR